MNDSISSYNFIITKKCAPNIISIMISSCFSVFFYSTPHVCIFVWMSKSSDKLLIDQSNNMSIYFVRCIYTFWLLLNFFLPFSLFCLPFFPLFNNNLMSSFFIVIFSFLLFLFPSSFDRTTNTQKKLYEYFCWGG